MTDSNTTTAKIKPRDAHPLPDGWRWDGAVARLGDGIGSLAVYVDDLGELVSEMIIIGSECFHDDTMHADPPADVALAVLLAYRDRGPVRGAP